MSAQTPTPVEAEQKAIAETLRLRQPGPPVARVSRKALIVTIGALSLGVAGAVGWSLMEKPPRAPPEPSYQPAKPPEKITALPKDYLTRGQPPALGPPLPGDLGRPIVSAGLAGPSEQAAPQTATAYQPQQLVDPAIEAARVERRAARSSGLFLATSAGGQPSAQASSTASGDKAQAAEDARIASPERLQAPASPYILQAGSVIPAALVTALRSDAAGLAIAQVTQDVRDSLGGGHLLIPAGARLIGEYGTTTLDGQSRLGVAWTRLILPSGRSIVLDKLPAADPQGMAGLEDGVDRHWSRVWSAAALSTVLSVGAEAGASGEGDLSRAVRRGVGQAVGDVGQQAVGKSLALTPTLTIRAGAPLRVLLSRDLVLEPYRQGDMR